VHTSVIVPTYQRRDLVVAAVNALASQSFSEAYEIVVVVDGSTDGTAEALRKIRAGVPIRILEQENQGLSAARNAGASAASGDILLFLDDDMEADSRLLAEHASAHRNGPALVMGHIPLHPDSPRNFLSDAVAEWAEERRKHLVEPGATPGLHDWLMGQASIPRSEFFRLGGFDTNFTRFGSYGNEDFDFCYRVSRAGIPILFNERALSAQRYVVDAQKHLDQWRDAGAADVNLARKYPELLNATFSSKQYPPGWLLVLYRPLRRLSLALISAGASGRFVRGLFFLVRGLARELGVRSAGGIPDSMSLQILCYHALSDLSGTVLSSYGIAPDEIHQQLDALRQANYQFVTPAEFLRFIVRKGGLPRRALLLTFDDCYLIKLREKKLEL